MEYKFKVGDRVRVVRKTNSGHKYELGYEGEIKDIVGKRLEDCYDLGAWFVGEDEIELIDKPHKEGTGSFMVFVEGRRFPKVKHTLADAHKEAKRLCLKEKRRAHIISTFGCYELSAEFKGDF